MGDSNGNIWGWIWKFNMALLPFIIGLGIWLVTQSFKHEAKIMQLEQQDELLEANIHNWVRENYPPDELVSDIKRIQRDINEIKIELAKR